MYKREDIMQFFKGLVDEIQERIYGQAYIKEDIITRTYKICIFDRDIKYVFDLTDKLYEIETQQDKDKLVHDIIQQYKAYILGAYIVG